MGRIASVRAWRRSLSGKTKKSWSVWDDQCSNCHQWTEERLCDQAKTYVTNDVSVLRLQHPLGTRFKVALGKWAQNGCK